MSNFFPPATLVTCLLSLLPSSSFLLLGSSFFSLSLSLSFLNNTDRGLNVHSTTTTLQELHNEARKRYQKKKKKLKKSGDLSMKLAPFPEVSESCSISLLSVSLLLLTSLLYSLPSSLFSLPPSLLPPSSTPATDRSRA